MKQTLADVLVIVTLLHAAATLRSLQKPRSNIFREKLLIIEDETYDKSFAHFCVLRAIEGFSFETK